MRETHARCLRLGRTVVVGKKPSNVSETVRLVCSHRWRCIDLNILIDD